MDIWKKILLDFNPGQSLEAKERIA